MPPGIVLHRLAQTSDGVGAFLMLTGSCIGPAAALRFGLITHCCAESAFPAIAAGLADADPVDPILDRQQNEHALEERPEPSHDLLRCFDQPTIPDIASALRQDGHGAVADDLDRLDAASPAARAALAALGLARTLDIREATIVGARADRLLIEPDAGLRTGAGWARLLAKPHAVDLELPSRAELQSLRRSTRAS